MSLFVRAPMFACKRPLVRPLALLTRPQQPQFVVRRAMASSTGKTEWLIILPDYADALQRRLDIRPKHFEELKPRIDSGVIVMGGAILEEPAKEGETLKFKGSAMIVSAETREEVMADLKSDVYFKNSVWDLDNAQIYPFKCAVRKGL